MIRFILNAIREARANRQFIQMAESDDFWQPVDGQVLVNFLAKSPTGQKLRARLGNMVFKSAVHACKVTENGDYERGKARGILLVIQAIDQHMDIAFQPQVKDFSESHAVNSDISELADLPSR